MFEIATDALKRTAPAITTRATQGLTQLACDE